MISYLKEKYRRYKIIKSLPKPIRDIMKQYKGKTVALASNGPSVVRIVTENGERKVAWSADLSELNIPIWTLNGGWYYHPKSELGFNMDDVDVDEWWDGCDLDFNRDNIQNAKIPVFTSTAYTKYDSLLNFPLKQCVEYFNFAYFNESLNYMIAFAVMAGVKEIHLYGCDYSDQHEYPEERASVEFWLGVAQANGLVIKTGPASEVLKGRYREGMHPRFYGYKMENFHEHYQDPYVEAQVEVYEEYKKYEEEVPKSKMSTDQYEVIDPEYAQEQLKKFYEKLTVPEGNLPI
jgi:hypothetical protein